MIMVTVRASNYDIVGGLDAGADDYLTKPIDQAELGARICAMLRIARLEQENLTLRQAVQNQEGGFKGVIGKSRAVEGV